MKNLILIILLFTSILSFSQEEKENYKTIAKQFKALYNENDYEAIFNMFDKAMKEALPLASATNFFNQSLKTNIGAIDTMEFYKTKLTAHIYKTSFEKAVMDVFIFLNHANQINGLFVKQHIPSKQLILERNTTKMILPFNEEWFVFWGNFS